MGLRACPGSEYPVQPPARLTGTVVYVALFLENFFIITYNQTLVNDQSGLRWMNQVYHEQ